MKTKNSSTTLAQKLAVETVDQLWAANLPADHADYGFAFDRAIEKLNVKQTVDKWTDANYAEFGSEFQRHINHVISQATYG